MMDANESRHRFRLKGKEAEDVVQALAAHSFLEDWCYPNPTLPDGKELCDLLVVFDQVAIIWQIKNLKIGPDGRYNRKDVEKNNRQLDGARRQCFDLRRPITLRNLRRGDELFDPSVIREIYLISVLAGEGEEMFPLAGTIKDKTVHVFTSQFVEIALNELDTISDFVAYLREKESLLEHRARLCIMGGEEELLGHYLFHNRSFKDLVSFTSVLLDEGSWDRLRQRPEYLARERANKISYGWDFMIDQLHDRGNPEYERVAREMARSNRFERRYLSKVFFDAYKKAHADEHDFLRRVLVMEGRTYCFLFADYPDARERRCNSLMALCYMARAKFPQNTTVIGIATEKKIRPEFAFEVFLLDKAEWTPADQSRADHLQKSTRILTNVTLGSMSEDEYPKMQETSEDAG
jgi:hypothetical protein